MEDKGKELEELKKEYYKVLRGKPPSYFMEKEPLSDEKVRATVDKMIVAIEKTDYPSDWLKYNPALKEASKKFGITKSSELRELVHDVKRKRKLRSVS